MRYPDRNAICHKHVHTYFLNLTVNDIKVTIFPNINIRVFTLLKNIKLDFQYKKLILDYNRIY